jgi:YVTN family beta-propeller protein
MKGKLYLLAICVFILPSLVLVSCGKSATTTSSNSTQTTNSSQTSTSTNSTTSNSSNPTATAATATITLGVSSTGNPTGLGYDSNGEIFVTNGGAASGNNFPPSWVISDATNTAVQAVFSGRSSIPANGVVYDAGKSEFFLTETNSYGVAVVSDANPAQVATVAVPQTGIYQPNAMVYDSVDGKIFVANGGGGTVLVISDSTNSVVTTIPMFGASGLAYDSGTGNVYVGTTTLGSGNSYTESVSVISGSNNTVVGTVALPPGGSYGPMAYDSAQGKIFVTDSSSGAIYVISDSTNKVVATVTLPKLSDPSAIAYDSGTGEIFVANPGESTAPGTVSIISGSNNAIIGTVTVGTGPNALAYDSGKGEMLVSNGMDNTVSVISDSSHK